MAFFHRQHKPRRVSEDRSKPVSPGVSVSGAPQGKLIGRNVITVVFLLAATITLNFPSSGPALRVGDVARRDLRARVSFEMGDIEATRRAIADAEARCPRIFVEDASHLERIPDECGRFLDAVREAHNPVNLSAEGRENWGITAKKILWLKDGLSEKWITRALPVVAASLTRAAEFGIMDGSSRQREIAADRFTMVVYSDVTPDQRETRQVEVPFEYPGGLREFFEDDLIAILSEKDPHFQETFIDILTHRAKPTLRFDTAATDHALQLARETVQQRKRRIEEGSIMLPAGEQVTQETLRTLRRETAEYRALKGVAYDVEGSLQRLRMQMKRGTGVTLVFLTGFALLALYALRLANRPLASNTRVFGIYVVMLVVFLTLRVLGEFGVSQHWTPVVFAGMLVVVAGGPTLAFGVCGLLAIVAGVATNTGLMLVLPLLCGASAAILGLRRLRRRTDMIEAGLLAGVLHFVVVWAVYLAAFPEDATAVSWPIAESLAGLGGGVFAGFVLSGTLPYVEKFFDVATDLRLFEWTDQNQPLLRKLALDAPGTYHHSTLVSNIAEAAAEKVGANALLARAGAYVHDVGKLNRPEFFIENMGGVASLHDGLSPMMSTMVLTAHTKDGVELAARYGVPSPLRRIIAQHHGTSVVEYFYKKAVQCESDTPVNRDSFRYRGAKPQSPEAAIVMLADSAESAARSIGNASPRRIEKLVHEIVEKRLEDGQLDESRMNITDIRRVEKSIIRSLMAISHPRIRYPGS